MIQRRTLYISIINIIIQLFEKCTFKDIIKVSVFKFFWLKFYFEYFIFVLICTFLTMHHYSKSFPIAKILDFLHGHCHKLRTGKRIIYWIGHPNHSPTLQTRLPYFESMSRFFTSSVVIVTYLVFEDPCEVHSISKETNAFIVKQFNASLSSFQGY